MEIATLGLFACWVQSGGGFFYRSLVPHLLIGLLRYEGGKMLKPGIIALFGMFMIVVSSTSFADSVLVLGDDLSEGFVVPHLTGLGHTVTNPDIYYDWDPGPAADLSGYDAVVMLYGYDYDYGITANASSALTSYIQGGGRFVTTAWMAYSHEDFAGDPIFDVLPVAYDDEGYDAVWDVDETSPIFTGLSDGWSDSEGFEYVTVTDPSAVALGSNQYGEPLVVYTENANGGLYIYLNHTMSYDTSDVSTQALTLVSNAVGFAPVPEPSSLTTMFLGIGCLVGLARRRHKCMTNTFTRSFDM